MRKILLIKPKNILIISTLLLTMLTFIFCIGALSTKSVLGVNTNGIKIVLDAGHGGIDGGVVGKVTKVKESELNLKVVYKLKKYLVDSGFEVVLTRVDDDGLYGVASSSLKKKDMQRRKQIIESENPDAVISVHMNYYSLSSCRGAQVFYKKTDKKSELLATSIQNSFNEMEEMTRKNNPLTGDYFILNCSNIPSVICECGFLSNKDDEQLLIKDEYQDKIAYSIFKGLVGFLVETTSLTDKIIL